MKIKSLDAVTKKWTEVTPGRSEYYKEGTSGKGGAWEAGAKAGEGNWKTGVAAASAAGLFGKGVARAGGATYEKGVLEKGVARWPQGVGVAGPEYSKGFGPYHSVLGGLTLPPKGPKGSPANYARVQAIGTALRAKKMAG
jgi:hypothetical protein